MAKQTGRQQNIGIARESTRGTAVAPAIWVPKINFSFDDKVSKARFEGSYGNIFPGDDAFVALQWGEGNMEFEMTDVSMGLFLRWIFGGLSSASFMSANKHSITASNSVQHNSLSIAVKDEIDSHVFPLCMVNNFQLISEIGELVKCNIDFVGKKHKDWTALTPSYTAENKFIHQNLTFKTAANEGALAAAAAIPIRRLELNIAKNAIRENALGTVQPVDIINGMISIQGRIMLTMEDRSYRDLMVDGTKKAVLINFTNSDVTIGSTNPQVQLELPVVDFENWEPTHPNDDLATQEIVFNALYDVANDQFIGDDTFVVNSHDGTNY